MCQVPDTSTQRPALRPNSPHHVEHYIVHGPGDARDGSRERLLWPMTFTPQANLQFSAPSIQNSVAHAAATSAAASARHAARPASMLSACTALTPWAQYMVVLVLQFIWRQRGSKPRGSGLRVSTTRRRYRHLRALKVRLWSLELPPARALKSCPVTHASQLPHACLHASSCVPSRP